MTEQTTTDQTTEQTTVQDDENTDNLEADTGAPDSEHATEDNEGAREDHRNNEAKRYRLRLRETEAERDKLTEQIAGHEQTIRALQRRLIETAAATTLRDPADLWRYDNLEVTDLLDDQGIPDPEKIIAAVDNMTAQRRHLERPRTPKPDRKQGAGGPPATIAPADPVAAYLADWSR